MSGVDLDHPEVIFVKRLDGSGYGFFYSTPAQFDNAANGFIGPIKAKITEESEKDGKLKADANALCLKAAQTAIENVFESGWNDYEGLDGTRCVAASLAQETKWEGEIPSCLVIEKVGDDTIIREGFEFMEHPGYPLAIIIGSKQDGGGLATFFDSFDEFKQVASKPASQSCWLPQLIYRLYVKTPSIMTGVPTPPSEGKTGIGVECYAYTLNRQGHLIERQRRP